MSKESRKKIFTAMMMKNNNQASDSHKHHGMRAQRDYEQPDKEQPIKLHCIQCVNDLVITEDENISIIDNGCNQSILNINSFLIQTHTGIYFSVGGALESMTLSNLEVITDAFTIAILPWTNENVILHFLNQDVVLVSHDNNNQHPTKLCLALLLQDPASKALHPAKLSRNLQTEQGQSFLLLSSTGVGIQSSLTLAYTQATCQKHVQRNLTGFLSALRHHKLSGP